MKEDTSKLMRIIETDEAGVRDYPGRVGPRLDGGGAQGTVGHRDRPAVNAARYEGTEARRATRAGAYRCWLHTCACEATLNMSNLHLQIF